VSCTLNQFVSGTQTLLLPLTSILLNLFTPKDAGVRRELCALR
jgi:hypothetical protein